MNSRPHIAILGAGAIGRAIAHLLRTADIRALLWDIDPQKVPGQGSLADTVSGADILFLCLPSWALRSALMNALPHLSRHTIVVSPAKGIESKTRLTMDALIAAMVPRHSFALLDGPMLAREIVDGSPAGAVVATTSRRVAGELTRAFAGTPLVLECSRDVRGVALSGVLKNIYAIGFGIADGLAWGSNQKGLLMVQAIREMRAIVPALGGRSETVLGPAGLGDLVATGLSAHSGNHAFGLELAARGKSPIQSEGARSFSSVVSLLHKKISPYPILRALERTLRTPSHTKKIFQKLLTRG